jgi:uncharacterized protein YndB with AHSA1/START domain
MRTAMEERHEVTISRIFSASPGSVWGMWTSPVHFMKWFGSAPMRIPENEIFMDVRVGGQFRATMVSDADGKRQSFVGVYKMVEPNERLVLELQNPENRQDPKVETLTVLLKGTDAGTEMMFTQSGYLPLEAYEVGLLQGYKKFFDQMQWYFISYPADRDGH